MVSPSGSMWLVKLVFALCYKEKLKPLVNKIVNVTIGLMKNKPVVQLDKLGCGVACVASFLEISYDEAIFLFDNGNERAKTTGFWCKEIVEALSKKGVTTEYKYLKPKIKRLIYKTGTIVFVRKSKRDPAGHYLLRLNSRWMDPWKNFYQNKNIEEACAGYIKRLPDRPIYAIFVKNFVPD